MADGQMDIGISGGLKNAALSGIFKNINNLLVVGNDTNVYNLFEFILMHAPEHLRTGPSASLKVFS